MLFYIKETDHILDITLSVCTQACQQPGEQERGGSAKPIVYSLYLTKP